MKTVKYSTPAEAAPKLLIPLAHSDIMFCAVQVVRKGGENNLHSHEAMDGLWFVLRGRARFYGEGHKLIGEFGQHEGVFVPRNVPYWFESIGDEPLEILQAESIDRRLNHNRRTDYEPQKPSAITHKVVRANS
jgi:mannose-6-phosphate isomerase-like protein (cupin superfamily)